MSDEDRSPNLSGAYLFEVAFEVMSKLGGIYTVLRSKAPQMTERWGDRYCMIGPQENSSAEMEFEPRRTAGPLAKAIRAMNADGLVCHYGRLLVPGNPRVLLMDTDSAAGRLAETKYYLWKDLGVETRAGDGQLDQSIALGYMVREFFRRFCSAAGRSVARGVRPVIGHFHEWMGAVAIPLIRQAKLPVATVFTTHATLLGRYLSSVEADLQQVLPQVNPEQVARGFDVYDRYSLERRAATDADVMTTVSEITAEEAKALLGREVEVVLPNGLNIRRFAAIHEFQNLHRQYKQRLHEFVMAHFFPSYSFDLDKTLYFFTAGRYEHRNKGIDLFIESLARLEMELAAAGSDVTVVAFIVAPTRVRSVNVDVLSHRAMFEELRSQCRIAAELAGQRLLSATARGLVPEGADLLDDNALLRIKRTMQARRSEGLPIICTHDVVNDGADPVLCQLRQVGLINRPSQRVKVIFHPEFLRSTNPLLGLEYDQFVRGCHLGVFPSYYEPWGNTPMESAASGTPAITSDLSGFGAFLAGHLPGHDEKGLFVLRRRGRSFGQSAAELTERMNWFCRLNRRQRVMLRNDVEGMSELFDWGRMIGNYDQAAALAVDRMAQRLEKE